MAPSAADCRHAPAAPLRRRFSVLRRAAALMSWAAILMGNTSCFPVDDGREPPLSRLYFPVGVQLSSGFDRVYVANSDFDLQFNGGSLLVLDAERIREMLPVTCNTDADCGSGQRCDSDASAAAEREQIPSPTHWCVEDLDNPCGVLGAKSRDQIQLRPGLCNYVELERPQDGGSSLILDAAKVSAFVTDLRYAVDPDGDKARLFLPARGDATLHWADVEHDAEGSGPVLDCGQNPDGECDAEHRRGDDRDERSDSGDRLPIEPFGIALTDDAEAVVLSHQTQGSVSLFVNDWSDGAQGGPHLRHILTGLPRRPVGVASVPVPEIARRGSSEDYQPGFWVTFRGLTRSIQLLRYHDEASANRGVTDGGEPFGPFLELARQTSVSVTGTADTRSIAVDDAARRACESDCADDEACLQACTAVPLNAYVASRTPDSLLYGQTQPIHSEFATDDVPSLTDVAPLRGGPSRVYIADVIDENAELARRVFVISFDARLIYVFDPERRSLETRIETGRGPHALSVDSEHGIAYVTHFTDSYLSVIDLDKRHRSYGQLILTVGKPLAPRTAR